MTTYAIESDEGNLLDARFEIFPSAIIIHSRGGTKGKDAINPDYSVALRLLLNRLSTNNIAIAGAWVDSSRVQHLPLSARAILSTDDRSVTPEERFKLLTSRMQKVGRVSTTGGNPTKKVRLELEGDLPASSIAEALKAVPSSIDLRSLDRLPADDLNKVTPEHIWNAIQKLLGGYTDHGFGESTDFDLRTDDGQRLPPKAVFGIAAAEALGFVVLPKHFSGGERSPCFRMLTSAGYTIVPKSGDPATGLQNNVASLASDEQWTEGRRRLVTHVRKERGAGLAQAKKAQFRRQYGKLKCERCDLDPVAKYGGEHGEASIEVHHRATEVKDMDEAHVTKLDDLQCLCANCHRVEHRLLRARETETALLKKMKETVIEA